jgi:uncharacterized RDD family membrane protein YckC
MADAASFQSFIRSKIALIAAAQLAFLVVASLALMITGNGSVALIYFAASYFFCTVLSVYKYGQLTGKAWMYVPVIFYCYLWGRSLSLLDSLWLKLKATFKPS